MARLTAAHAELRQLKATGGPRLEFDVHRSLAELREVSSALLGTDGSSPSLAVAEGLLAGVERRLETLRERATPRPS
jgi:hypothetical protein